MSPVVLSVASAKGGTGKTTTVTNLAGAMAEFGLSVVIVDLDPQAHASLWFGTPARRDELSISSILDPEETPDPTPVIRQTAHPRVGVIPANPDALGEVTEPTLRSHHVGPYRLRTALEQLPDVVDLVIIDTPPNKGVLVQSALLASDFVVAVTLAEPGSSGGAAWVQRAARDLAAVRARPELTFAGTIYNRFDPRRAIANELYALAQESDERPFCCRIPQNVEAAEAVLDRLPVVLTAPRSKVAQAFVELARELAGRLQIELPDPAPPKDVPSIDPPHLPASMSASSSNKERP